LSARAISFDDDQYLTENRLVQNPSWSAARQFLTEILEPSTVRGYYQPLAMISLMLDRAVAGPGDDLHPFHRTSLALHVGNTGLVMVLLYILFKQPSCIGWAISTRLSNTMRPLLKSIRTTPWPTTTWARS
jgi:hypothetical protein